MDINNIINKINKSVGPNSVMRLDAKPSIDIPAISSGSIGLDYALGVGGYPRGRIIEIYGPESSGKTTVALHAIAQAQKAGAVAAFIDVEHALDPAYANNIGVNLAKIIFSQPDNAEQALDIADLLCSPDKPDERVDLIVVDSVAALVPKAELEGEMGDSHVGVHARLMSQAMRKITAKLNKSGTTIIFINQIREKIGVMFGSPETTSGGRALKFFASVRLDVRRGTPIKSGDAQIGGRAKIKVVKNKVAPPFKEAEIDVIYGFGFSREGELCDFGKDLGILDVSGSWYSYKSQRIGQGRQSAIEWLKANPTISTSIDKEIREKLEIA